VTSLDIQKLMTLAQDSLRAARLLSSDQLYGFAISRAYYAMFYVAEALLLAKGLSFSKHSAVIAALGQHFVKTNLLPAHFHRYLIEAEKERLAGDYDPDAQFDEANTRQQIEHAEAFIAAAQDWLKANPKTY
jgi:uncharacterized protein (UPF0332 family)